MILELRKYKSKRFDLLPEDRRKQCIEIALNGYYSEIGSYFRIFHRIIKYINEKVPNKDSKKDYFGF